MTTLATGRALDPDQQHLVDRLDEVLSSLTADPENADARRGLYVHGSVGRGKTWLCDAFFAGAPTTAKLRIHVHDLLHDLHQAIWRARSAGSDSTGSDSADRPDAIELALAEMLGDLELLYLDEVHLHDPADAVMLGRVLQAVFDRGILLIATSNSAPDELLPSREFHSLAEPAIALIGAHLDTVELGGTLDYRRTDVPARTPRESGFVSGFWVSEAELDELSPGDLRRPTAAEGTVLSTNGHHFTARRADAGLVWFHFDDLCEGDTSILDYLIWSREFHTWVIEGLPPLHTATPQARQRFAHIIDVLVDRDVTLHVISDSSRSEISGAAGPRDAERLHSRLALLRSAR